MDLPLSPPIKPQLALTRKQLPEGEEWAYEPKLDGFRAIVFVDLAEGDEVLGERPLRERRRRLEAIAEKAGLEPTPLSPDSAQAEQWLNSIEGVMAKDLGAPYVPGKRKGMAKVKRERTIDCVVMGWRPGKEEGTVGSLILGLYDGAELRTVGH